MQLEQDPIHRHKDVLAHTIAVVAKTSPRLRLRLAALLHDVGKPGTRGYGPQGVTFHHHEVVGARMARERLLALRYPNDVVDDVAKLVELHLRFHTYRMGWTDSAVRRYVRDAGPAARRPQRADPLRLHDAQRAARPPRSARRMDELEARIAELREQEELAKIRPALDGNAVMESSACRPGRDRRRGARRSCSRSGSKRAPIARGRSRRARLRGVGPRATGSSLPVAA